MKKAINVLILFFCLAVIITFCFVSVSCKKKGNQESPAVETNVKEVSRHHKWYYFSDSEVLPIDKPQNVPLKSFVPWTEAVRISSSNNTTGAALGDYDSFALVNRAGVLCFNGSEFSLKNDITLFQDRTAENLVFFNDTPLFSVYKSSFFNNSISGPSYRDDVLQHYFLVQFDVNTGVSYPILNCNNITIKK